jgi:hypothetical protein
MSASGLGDVQGPAGCVTIGEGSGEACMTLLTRPDMWLLLERAKASMPTSLDRQTTLRCPGN